VAEQFIETFMRVMPRLARTFKLQMRGGPLTPQQMFMVSEIQEITERQSDGAQPGELAKHCGLSAPGVTAALDDLVAAGYCVRAHGERDRRKVYVRLTDYGREALDATRRELMVAIRGMLGEMFAGWDETRLRELTALLGDLDQVVDAYVERQRS
jgi:DNA-binding MarR family transcriptional regulator